MLFIIGFVFYKLLFTTFLFIFYYRFHILFLFNYKLHCVQIFYFFFQYIEFCSLLVFLVFFVSWYLIVSSTKTPIVYQLKSYYLTYLNIWKLQKRHGIFRCFRLRLIACMYREMILGSDPYLFLNQQVSIQPKLEIRLISACGRTGHHAEPPLSFLSFLL